MKQIRQITAGVDEVGRGPWAGPVIAAAVILPEDISMLDLRDSKKMSVKARAAADIAIRASARYAFGAASVQEIDKLNIRRATLLAMRRSVLSLPIRPEFVEIDGRDIPTLPMKARAIIKGDETCPHIAAASIIAKELRDKLMKQLAARYPHFAWDANAGYGTKAHQIALNAHGITPHHRRSFKPIAARL